MLELRDDASSVQHHYLEVAWTSFTTVDALLPQAPIVRLS